LKSAEIHGNAGRSPVPQLAEWTSFLAFQELAFVTCKIAKLSYVAGAEIPKRHLAANSLK
jgi:hypothetical protein